MIDKQNKPLIANSTQELQNDSFDREFGVAVVEGLVYNQVTGTLDRMVQPGQELPTSGLNGSIALSYDGSGNLQYIDETIGSTTYRTTLTYDGSNNLTGVSSAVET